MVTYEFLVTLGPPAELAYPGKERGFQSMAGDVLTPLGEQPALQSSSRSHKVASVAGIDTEPKVPILSQ